MRRQSRLLIALVMSLLIGGMMVLPGLASGEESYSSSSSLSSIFHPSFRAPRPDTGDTSTGDGNTVNDVFTGQVVLDWQALGKAQMRAYKGLDSWRLDPLAVAREEGKAYGFDPANDRFALVSKVDVGQWSGTGEAKVAVLHGGRVYEIGLIQPFGPDAYAIWTINSIRKLTWASDADELTIIGKILAESFDPSLPGAPGTGTARDGSDWQRGMKYYRVRQGDTLWIIARKNGTTIYRLRQLNPGLWSDILEVGQVIIIDTTGTPGPVDNGSPAWQPGRGSGISSVIHIVEPGDTLWQIAVKYQASVRDIMNWNGITDPNTLWVGQRLIIPVHA
ncbi:MAG TPA: LysM peptidoglycan-binding domain-containing protein [Firmicutes bacterium]|nr:LysM peptidoglycan-binding domain-containing protein [Bacillota bacterium]